MTHVNFTIESKLNGDKGELVAGTILKNEVSIPKRNVREFSLKPGDELSIKVKKNGKTVNLGNGYNIWILPPEGVKTQLTTTKQELKITLESINTKDKAENYSVTVGAVNTG
jgi:bifunctional DNA-binding transcriptional regulator/antitoxin component of YhaV-PrlF toxin-antitoxin module